MHTHPPHPPFPLHLKVVVDQPIPGHWWKNANPYTLMGNCQNWTDYTVEAAVLMVPHPTPTHYLTGRHAGIMTPDATYARVCGRIASFKTDGSTPRGCV